MPPWMCAQLAAQAIIDDLAANGAPIAAVAPPPRAETREPALAAAGVAAVSAAALAAALATHFA